MTLPVIGGHQLSLAIELIDGYTGQQPVRPPSVRATDPPASFVRTPHGAHVLVNLAASVDSVAVRIDDHPGYLPVETTIDDVLAEPDPDYVPTSITLTPSPAYRFEPTATLVHGTVTADDDPVPGATVRVAGPAEPDDAVHPRSRATRTDGNGAFVAFFRSLTDDDVAAAYDDGPDLGRRVVHVEGEQPEVRVTHPDTAVTQATPVAIPVGGTASVDVTL